jgi:hypothetical protein
MLGYAKYTTLGVGGRVGGGAESRAILTRQDSAPSLKTSQDKTGLRVKTSKTKGSILFVCLWTTLGTPWLRAKTSETWHAIISFYFQLDWHPINPENDAQYWEVDIHHRGEDVTGSTCEA